MEKVRDPLTGEPDRASMLMALKRWLDAASSKANSDSCRQSEEEFHAIHLGLSVQ